MTITDFTPRRVLGYSPDGLPFYSIRGAEQGTSTAGDVVTQTIDGQPINNIWDEFQKTLDIVNTQRDAVARLLGFNTARSADAVAQTVGDDQFEMASEFGEPVGLRSISSHLTMGYPFKDWDKATRFTWRFLRDATQEQIESTHQRVLTADNQLTTTAILRRLMDPTAGVNEDGRTVYGLWNNDSTVPPTYLFSSFLSSHNHYMVSGGTTVDGKDIDDLYRNVAEHGYLDVPGSRAILLANPAQIDAIARIRVDDAADPAYDFIPSAGAAPYLTTEQIVGDVAPAEYNGLKIVGSYGKTWIAESGFIPTGYLLLVATGGPGSTNNPVGFREHINPAYRGLRLLPGSNLNYPLVDSFYTRGFGVGVRHRGAAAVMQIKASGTYDIPTL